jgi:hypothetical protein
MRGVDGVAYCLHGHVSRAGVDLDHCKDANTESIAAWADKLITTAGTYCEISPSGTGFHLVGDVANIAPDDFKLARGSNGEAVDVFVRSTRFFTVTGQVFADLPFTDISPVIRELQAEHAARQSQHGGKTDTRNPDELGPEIAKLIRDGAPPGSDRSRLFLRVIAAMRRAGFTHSDMIALLAAHPTGVATHALDKGPKELERQVDRCLAKVGARPVIQVADYVETAALTEKAILAAGLPLYRRDTALLVPAMRSVKGPDGSETRTAGLYRVSEPRLRQSMSEAALFTKFDGRGWKTVHPPKETAELILARADCWPFPEVHGVLTAPTLRPDGTILDQSGYDPATGLFVFDLPGMPTLSSNPDKAEAELALAELLTLVEEVPFIDDASRSIALDAMITPMVRAAFTATPMKVFSAPIAGTGKSYCVDIASAIVSGFPAPAQAWSNEPRENEKALAGAALSGYPLLSLDNINGTLESSFLCQLIERPLVEIRRLGTSDKFHIEPRGITYFATGNNIVIAGDLIRRSLVASLDAGEEDPYRRIFKRDLLAMIAANRGRYIAACLTICRAYRLAGSPDRLPPLASFEGWSNCVRSALCWLGRTDPCDTEVDPGFGTRGLVG